MQSQQTLELRQRQQLALTPQLQQSIRFLQLSSLELSQELALAVLENPMLESESEYDTDDEFSVEPDVPSLTADWSKLGRGHSDNEDGPQIASSQTLQEHLLQQLSAAHTHSRDHALVQLLAYELNDDGYLATSVPDVVTYLQRHHAVTEADVLSALTLLQSFEPAGVGARTLAECLTLQLERRNHSDDADVAACALTIVRDHLDLLASGNLTRLRQALRCDAAVLSEAHGLILSLEPRPARHWATNVADYVVPDVFVRQVGSRWGAVLNPAILPRVRVHALYSEMVGRAPDSENLRIKLQQAQGLVKSLHHRSDTILRVSQAIVEHQQQFFEQGMQAMRPLILRDIAERLEVHESTVSRAARFKYAQTPYGVIELRTFFGTTLDTEDGDTTSRNAVQFMIAGLIENEPRAKPLSDSKIADHLAAKGIRIARRTVAKYRDNAGIEPAIRRKVRYSRLSSCK